MVKHVLKMAPKNVLVATMEITSRNFISARRINAPAETELELQEIDVKNIILNSVTRVILDSMELLTVLASTTHVYAKMALPSQVNHV